MLSALQSTVGCWAQHVNMSPQHVNMSAQQNKVNMALFQESLTRVQTSKVVWHTNYFLLYMIYSF